MIDLKVNKAVVERFVAEYYQAGNLEVFDELLAPDFLFSGVGGEVRGDVEELKRIASATHGMIHTAFPDIRFEISELVAEGESVVAHLLETGTMTGPYVAGPIRVEATGKVVRIRAMELFHLGGGRIRERWAVRDRLGLLQQIGAPIQVG